MQEITLFSSQESDIISTFMQLPNDAQLLFFKLLMRDYKILLACSLKYPAIHDIPLAINQLLRSNLLINIPHSSQTISTLLSLLVKPQLTALAKKRNLKISNQSVPQLTASILSHAKSQSEISTIGKSTSGYSRLKLQLSKDLGQLIKLNPSARNVFFKISIVYSRLTTYPPRPFLDSVLTNLKTNARAYPQYTIQRHVCIWNSSFELQEYCDSLKTHDLFTNLQIQSKWNEITNLIEIEILDQWKEHITNGTTHSSEIPWFQKYTTGAVLTRILNIGVYAYFRLKNYHEQQNLLQLLLNQNLHSLNRRGQWFEELIKIQDLYLDKQDARNTCILALQDEFVTSANRIAIQKRARKLYNNLEIPSEIIFSDEIDSKKHSKEIIIKSEKTTTKVGSKALWMFKGKSMTVEELALEYYKDEGWKGLHTENSIVQTIFGLFFWDILFMDKPGVFESEFQTHPLDLNSVHFYKSRQTEITQRIKEISKGDFSKLLETDARERPRKTLCIGVSWNISREDLLEIVECIGGERISRICEIFSKTFWMHRGGVPDLCLWKLKDKKFKLVEVKGAGDRLSEKQKIWLESLNEFGIETQVFKVAE